MKRVRPLGRRRTAVWAGVGALSVASACSLVLPASEVQCTTSSDCTARGQAFIGSVCVSQVCVTPSGQADASIRPDATTGGDAPAPSDASDAASGSEAASTNDWSCVGHVRWGDASGSTISVVSPYADFVTNAPIPGVRVIPCYAIDPMCLNRLNDGGVTDDSGSVSISVPSGFDGYLLSTWDAALPTLVYVDPPVYVSQTLSTQQLLSNDEITELVGVLGNVDGGPVTFRKDLGQLLLAAYDCQGALASGVHFAFSPAAHGAVIVYEANGLPSVTATATDVTGVAAIVDLPPGTLEVTAVLEATGQSIGVAAGYIEAGRITSFNVPPSPAP